MKVKPRTLYAPGLNATQAMIVPKVAGDYVAMLNPAESQYGRGYLFQFAQTGISGMVYGDDEAEAEYKALIILIGQGFSVWHPEAFVTSQDWIDEIHKLLPTYFDQSTVRALRVVREWEMRTRAQRLRDLAFVMRRTSRE